MKVKEIMTPEAKAIWLTESLADAAKLMWENDCGVLPIIKDGRKVDYVTGALPKAHFVEKIEKHLGQG